MDLSNKTKIPFEVIHSEASPLIIINFFDISFLPEDPEYLIGSFTINKTRSVSLLTQMKVICQEVIGDYSEFDTHEVFRTHLYNESKGELRLVESI